jgi:hypothetical protein
VRGARGGGSGGIEDGDGGEVRDGAGKHHPARYRRRGAGAVGVASLCCSGVGGEAASDFLFLELSIKSTVVLIKRMVPLRLPSTLEVEVGLAVFRLEFLPVFRQLCRHGIHCDPEKILVFIGVHAEVNGKLSHLIKNLPRKKSPANQNRVLDIVRPSLGDYLEFQEILGIVTQSQHRCHSQI